MAPRCCSGWAQSTRIGGEGLSFVPAPNKQLQRTVGRRRGRRAKARHCIVRSRRAGLRNTRPLNCGLGRQGAKEMQPLFVTKIELLESGQVAVTPTHDPNRMLRFIYRADEGVEWDDGAFRFLSVSSGALGAFTAIVVPWLLKWG